MPHSRPTKPSLLFSLRAVCRLGRVGLHLVYGLLIVGLAYPCIGPGKRRHIRHRWSRNLLSILGVRLNRVGVAAHGARMLVANHISWLDIFVINAVEPVAFVSKNDILGWPVIGTLARHSETLFLARGSHRSAHSASQLIAEILAAGTTVAVFPEGTTTNGRCVLPFRGALLQGALNAGVPVQPVALAYLTLRGEHSRAAAYCGDTSLLESLWSIAAAPSLCASMTHLAPLSTTGWERRALAAQCEASVRVALRHSPADPMQHAAERVQQAEPDSVSGALTESAIGAG